MKNKLLTISLTLAFLVMGCASETPAPDAAAPAAEQAESSSASDTVVIRPVGDNMQYETTEFTVKAGQTITLVMENVATSAAMQHNVVVLAMGADVNAFGMAAMQAGPDAGYIPADSDQIIAYTAMAKPGETTQIEFTVPSEPGDYPFVCTFPGHYALMQGVMKVEA